MLACNVDFHLAAEPISSGAWVDYRDEQGVTPLQVAVSNGDIVTPETRAVFYVCIAPRLHPSFDLGNCDPWDRRFGLISTPGV